MRRSGGLLISSSANMVSGEHAEYLYELIEDLRPHVDIVVETDQEFHNVPSTMIDLTGDGPEIIREGMGMKLLETYIS